MGLRRYLQTHRHAHWALADQVLVSGANFLTGIILARSLGPAIFGVFVVLQSVMLYVNAFQVSLIISPMLSTVPKLDVARRDDHLRGVLALQFVLSVVLALAVWLLGLAGYLIAGHEALTARTMGALASAVLMFQLQDWLRRFYFVHQRARAACLNDMLSYGSQVLLLLWATLDDTLDLELTLWIMALTSACAFFLGFLMASAALRPAFGHARAVLREGWRAGRDYFLAWQMQWLGTQGVLLAGAGLIGAQAAGGVRAAQNIIGPINILFQAMDNTVPVAAARNFAEGGLPALSRYLWRNTAWGSALLLPVMLLLTFAADPLTRFVYGSQYVAYSALVVWQAAAMFLQFYVRQVTYFLRTVEATAVIMRMGAVIAVTSVGVTVLTVHRYQETGLMIALLAGVAAGLVHALVAAYRVTRSLRAQGAVSHLAFAEPRGRR